MTFQKINNLSVYRMLEITNSYMITFQSKLVNIAIEKCFE